MYRFILALLVLDALILAGAVLLQAGKGGGLAASFGGAGSSPNSLLGSREAGNLLTKTSWTCGGIFIALAFILQIMSNNTRGAVRSVLDDAVGTTPTAPASAPPLPGATPASKAPLQPIAPSGGTGGTNSKQPPTGKQQ
ncbi:MAG TPA: preprotein translocase subunit SecG [Gemmatimonadaceae bacterium]|nr:preprotein translocase subunit SecG [Gemmatimonadaceae bacterium]